MASLLFHFLQSAVCLPHHPNGIPANPALRSGCNLYSKDKPLPKKINGVLPVDPTLNISGKYLSQCFTTSLSSNIQNFQGMG